MFEENVLEKLGMDKSEMDQGCYCQKGGRVLDKGLNLIVTVYVWICLLIINCSCVSYELPSFQINTFAL